MAQGAGKSGARW